MNEYDASSAKYCWTILSFQFTLLIGGCLKSKSPEGVTLEITDDTERNLALKREVIAKYLFNMAFENVQDPGYVTEKPWDALLAGKYR
jgi:Glycosyltransferase family 10 (fucosyltransferase) C-term